MSDIEIGDLVRLLEAHDPDRKIGIVIDVSPKYAQLVSHGKARVIKIYWPLLDTTDWEYDFSRENSN